MSDLDSFIGELKAEDPSVDESGEPVKKKRGRKPGSTNKKAEVEKITIDPAMVLPIVNLTFGFVVKSFGEAWEPNDEEREATALYARLVMEKRLPGIVGENLPEYMLGVVLLSYVGRVYLSQTLAGSGNNDNRETGEREIGPSEV